jgi:cysteinylglycine-S-conjugate dipeptidase
MTHATTDPAPHASVPGLDDVLDELGSGLERHLDDLQAFTRIPGISADGAHADDVIRSAGFARDLLKQAGLTDARVVAAPGGLPAVIASLPATSADAPTVLLYAHHDVQPVGPGWTGDAFEPVRRGERLYGRGIADDKAGVLVHVAALGAWLRARGAPPVNVRVLIEGEEEVGSPTLSALLAEHLSVLGADVLVVADGLNHGVGLPALTCLLRGRADVAIELAATATSVHSGTVGGLVRDPLLGMARVLASLTDAEGEIAIPDFAADAYVPDAAERRRLTDAGFDEVGFRADYGVIPGVTLGGGERHPLETLWLRPAVSIEGLDAPSVDGASSTLVGATRARVSIRLAPGQDPVRARARLAAWLEAQVPWGLSATITPGAAMPPYHTEPTSPAAEAALTALSEGYGREAVAAGVGGSIPFVAEASAALGGIPALITAVADPLTNAHGPDESLDIPGFLGACRSEVILLARLADALGTGPSA